LEFAQSAPVALQCIRFAYGGAAEVKLH
jgi:hypothetical protein